MSFGFQPLVCELFLDFFGVLSFCWSLLGSDEVSPSPRPDSQDRLSD